MPAPDMGTTKSPESIRGGPIGLVVCLPSVFGIELVPGRDLDIGRTQENGVAIDHDSVSRRHARLTWDGETASLEDLGSTNGTKVAGRRLAPHERAPLLIGTTFEIGSITVLVKPAETARSLVPGTASRSATPTGVIVQDPEMLKIYGLLAVVAPADIGVLVLGETGTGKEVFASSVHRMSHRSTAQFLALNCASLPESLLESELFGHERGAFTGATQTKPGLFEAADGGTLFLDEVGEMSLSTQAKLLRVLESGEVMRLGSVKPRHVDVRFVAATNRDLEARIDEGHFRADLYYRLNGITVRLPPLRERPQDIEALAQHFLVTAAKRLGKAPPALGLDARSALLAYGWPGNIRELRNVIDRATLLCQSGTIRAPELGLVRATRASAPPTTSPSSASASASTDLREVRSEFEKERILKVLEDCGGNQTRAAEKLGIARRTLVARLQQYGITKPRKE
jgi:transcriptional regulator with GAF, ATPase, and Fis domain